MPVESEFPSTPVTTGDRFRIWVYQRQAHPFDSGDDHEFHQQPWTVRTLGNALLGQQIAVLAGNQDNPGIALTANPGARGSGIWSVRFLHPARRDPESA